MENERVKIINKLMDMNCPRLNNNSSVVLRRNLRYVKWPGVVRLIPWIDKTKKKKRHMVLRFFQAQLRMKKKNCKLSSQIISKKHCSVNNFQFTSTTSCPVLRRHKRNMVVVGNHSENNNNRRRLLLSELPKELLAQILVRLPVKYILRCLCVLKSWNSFIKSTDFVTLHLNYHRNHQNVNPKYLLFRYQYCFGLTLRFDDLQCEEYRRLEFLPGFPSGAWFAPSYGLICASTILDPHGDKLHDHNIYLWNPLINKYKTLPKSPLPSIQNLKAWQALAFGFLPQLNDYVVIHVTKPCLPPHPHLVIIGVYSLNTNTWKISSQDNVFILNISRNRANVVFNNGAAFWVATNSSKQRILMCFDTKTNILSEISLPDSVASLPSVPVIHAFAQSVAYFVWEEGVIHFDMWVLNYDCMNEFTWEKKMCVTPSKDVLEKVLGVRNNGEPILLKSKHLISYNLDSHRPSGFVDSWDRWTPNYPYREGSGPPYVIRPFVESLVMLNND